MNAVRAVEPRLTRRSPPLRSTVVRLFGMYAEEEKDILVVLDGLSREHTNPRKSCQRHARPTGPWVPGCFFQAAKRASYDVKPVQPNIPVVNRKPTVNPKPQTLNPKSQP